ncbi:hypothetical protein [Bacillus sp. HSf4]|uniref:hypothetical protein n=1 Tax=Bacillus sp. HSf4 TaxID=3035514 RepID=UPI00240A3383|nr:hypothetical protein [Bacillus sp. HSf4]WFA07610.1 hypothetical protein P3X63_04340 [Bacillus sp. HSf4]
MASPTQSNMPLTLTIDTELSVLATTVSTSDGQSVKLDSMAEVDIIVGPAGLFQYSIVFSFYRNGEVIAQVTEDNQGEKSTGLIRLYSDIPNLTWVDNPGSGTQTYELRITVTGNNILTASANTRSLTAVIYG